MGLFDRGGGQDAGNAFQEGGASGYNPNLSQYSLREGLSSTLNNAKSGNQGVSTATVQNNPILGQLFGAGGQMEQAGQQVNNLTNTGYSLQPEDHEAYGQASGNIARMFGSQEQGLAENLASRGLSNSGVAGQQFSNMYGNKQEQLAGLQTDIAQKRMAMNQQRLQEMHGFLSNLGQQAQGAIGQASNIQNNSLMQDYNMRTDLLSKIQNQNNEALGQRSQTSTPSTGEQIGGGLGMIGSALDIGSAAKGLFSRKGSLGATKMAGQSSSNGGVFA